jgi:integrase
MTQNTMKPTLIETGKKAEIVCGSASVRLTTSKNGKYFQHVLRWTIGSRSFRRVFSDRKKAIAEGERIARNLSSADGERTTVSTDDVLYYRECAKKLRPHSLHEAVDFFLKFHSVKSVNSSIAEIADAYVKAIDSRKEELSERYPESVKYETAVWKRWAGGTPIQSITTARIKELLDESGFAKTTKRNLVRRFRAMENFAMKNGSLSREHTSLVDEISLPREHKAPPIFTPEELMRLFIVLNKQEIGYVATMAFSGPRRAEFEKMTYDHLTFDEGQARIDSSIAKTKSRRTLDIEANLRDWLEIAALPKWGLLISKKRVAEISGDKGRLQQVGLVWKNNGLRHSFCSYHLARGKDAAKTSLLAGNSPDVIFAHYNAVVSHKAAEAWFNITPISVRAYANEKGLTQLITW